MTGSHCTRVDAYLDGLLPTQQLVSESRREQNITPVLTTVTAALRSLVIGTLVVLAAACGGNHQGGDTYAKATAAQQTCCEHLSGPGRDECLQKIVRVPDPQVAKVSANQASYACIEDKFVCDPQSGHATQASSQAALDCIQDLQ